ncbi:hypothetical protein AGMMS50239_21860 [Bacteroidia bacterium]|nr:hypothetical protein AGMMS50239_21860 [Bacteroidia bacterium]
MKKLLFLLCMLWVGVGLPAQNKLTGYEYWFDNDYSAKASAPIVPAATYRWQTMIPCEQLSAGIHTFNTRFKDQTGAYTPTISQYFQKLPEMPQGNKIVLSEYWIDDNYSQRVVQNIAPSANYATTATLDFNDLSAGLHVFNTRFRDSYGSWSTTVSQYFQKLPEMPQGNKIVLSEYWIDDNYSQRVVRNIAPSANYATTATLDFNDLSAGLHVFNTRFRDSHGNWSTTVSQYFQRFSPVIPKKLVAYEYWINDEYDKKFTAEINNEQTFVLLDSVNCSSVEKLINTVSYRFKDDAGQWSSVLTHEFYRPAGITLNMTYTHSVKAGETPVAEKWYPDYEDVRYDLFNVTKGTVIADTEIQYPLIFLNDPVAQGDEIHITAVSRTNKFKPVQSTVIVNDSNKLNATFNILQYGLIEAAYGESENEANVGIVYDSIGRRIAQYDYVNKILKTGELADGNYQLVSMGNSLFFNTIQHLSAFASTQLVENTDYVLQTVEVKSGEIKEIAIPTIPKLDEERLYYTGSKTLFSVNKTTIAIGNYVTLRGEIDFKEDYSDKISNVKLIVDIPENSTFVAGSVMVGGSVFGGYTFNNNQLIVPLANKPDVVHFCIIPIEGGAYYSNGFVEFDLEGGTIRQPIGAAWFSAENLSIIVPNYTAQKTIPVRGVVTPRSLVKVYDNGALIGQTTAFPNGNWLIRCPLNEPDLFSFHNIQAEILTPQGVTVWTETKETVFYEKAIEVSKVTMINTAHPANSQDLCEYVTVLDFLDPPNAAALYWYWPAYPKFTFKIEFTKNDSSLISDVYLDVRMSSGDVVSLPASYDNVRQVWVVVDAFPNSGSLPVNVTVRYSTKMLPENFETRNININPHPFAGQASLENLKERLEIAYKIYQDRGCTNTSVFRIYDEARQSIDRQIIEYAIFIIEHNPTCEDVNDLFVDIVSNSCNLNVIFVLDPSGYVYEAVSSNRLQDVTASIYAKVWEEDMYGDPIEKIVLWDAESHNQINPQLTNEYGEYGWDVPQGLWQVKYEKEGYETVYSEWLPVPPPQLDVNIAMVHAVPPHVGKVQGYETGINILFDKFMLPATMTTDLITVTRNGTGVPGTIKFLNAETNPANNSGQFVSKVRFVPETPFKITDEVILTVKKEVQSYAGIEMEKDFVQQIEIQKEVKSMQLTPVLDMALHGKDYLDVSVEPKEASAGKKVFARSVSSSIATVTGEAVLNEDGKARLQVDSELPGTTVIVVSLEETDLTATTTINVSTNLAVVTEQVETPVASLPSGSTVAKNTTVSLSSPTDGATVLYTLDGSLPSGPAALAYSQAIVIAEDITIKAMAVKEGMTDSEIAVFEYFVEAPVIQQVEIPVASLPSGSTVAKNTTVSLSSPTDGATVLYTLDGSLPSGPAALAYSQAIVIAEDITIKAMAVKEGMTDSEIAVFEYFVINDGTAVNQPEKRSIVVYVRNQTIFIRGLDPGEQYAVYSILGNAIIRGSIIDDVEQQVHLPSKGIFIISTSKIKAKVLVE